MDPVFIEPNMYRNWYSEVRMTDVMQIRRSYRTKYSTRQPAAFDLRARIKVDRISREVSSSRKNK